ncbi:dihydropteroate synthase [Caldalkalibacillus mannanilyticus]|uniref:dihydropteroate synthase n=1 Tax=Caldalkalibacillus mannanilyticus TaxID=1418 RepID=UPI00046ABB01|nr:dihydropteroate synthase [Caldalkalibacillus mannanilyticus]
MTRHHLQVGPHTLYLDQRTHIMGILNATPDSFSDGGKFNQVDHAIDRVSQMIKEGADIIDIGGESTRPGAPKVELEEELERVLPVVEAISSRFSIPLSIDTYKAEVAKQAIAKGAHIINDVWGAKADPQMAQVAAQTNSPIILMHNRSDRNYGDFMADAKQDLQDSIRIVQQAGVENRHIILDPGIGFAKSYSQNLMMMRNLNQLVEMGYPVLLGTSRKSMIGNTLQLPPEERVEGTVATVCLGIQLGCSIVRVHDVLAVSRAAKMMDAMLGKEVLVNHG